MIPGIENVSSFAADTAMNAVFFPFSNLFLWILDEELEAAIFPAGRKRHELLQVRFGNYVCFVTIGLSGAFALTECVWTGFTPAVVSAEWQTHATKS